MGRHLEILRALPGIVWRRLRSHVGLLIALWAGLTVAVALVVSVPIYAESAGYRILLAELARDGEGRQTPPFSVVYAYDYSSGPPISWDRYRQVDTVAADLRRAGVDVEPEEVVRHGATERLGLIWDTRRGPVELVRTNLAFVSGLMENVRIVDGAAPRPWGGTGPVDVVLSEESARGSSLLVDDVLRVESGFGGRAGVAVRITGVWRPTNERSAYWFNPPSTLGQMALMPEESFRALGGGTPVIRYAAWYTALRTETVRGDAAAPLVGQVRAVTSTLGRLLPGIELRVSPIDALVRHREQVRALTLTLALFGVPLLGLLGYFAAQLAGMTIARQRQEAAVLRSRGSSRVQLLTLALGEGLALAIAALLVGVPLGLFVAQLLVWTVGFLRFVPRPEPVVRLLAASWIHGMLALLVALAAIAVPALRAAGETIVGFKRERGREARRPLWRRLYLDLALLGVAVYGLVQLRRNGLIALPGVGSGGDDPFRNPVLMLAPALWVFALALVTLRLAPVLLRLLGGALGRTRGVAPLALRFLGRSAQAYSAPILLIALTLAMAAYTSSMAGSLDGHSVVRARYASGADLRLVYKPRVADTGSGGGGGGGAITSAPAGGIVLPEDQPPPGVAGAPGAAARPSGPPPPAYLTTPVDDYLALPGVREVARVARTDVGVVLPDGARGSARFLGVDRTRLPAVLGEAWRDDYAGESLGALLNRLGADPAAVLVSAAYARETGLGVGDRLALEMADLGETQRVPVVVAGVVELFPTLFPQDGPFLIGNLEYGFESQGGTYAYEVWLDTAPGTPLGEIATAAAYYELEAQETTPESLLVTDLERPERQGLFGLLSVGFLAAGLVTVLGFLATTLVGFERRLVEMGTLRALGLGARQLALMLAGEQALVVGLGAGAGVALGVLASRLFVPYLRVRTGDHPETPGFVVEVAWSQLALLCGVLALVLGGVIAVTLLLLRRLRVFEAVKLGEVV